MPIVNKCQASIQSAMEEINPEKDTDIVIGKSIFKIKISPLDGDSHTTKMDIYKKLETKHRNVQTMIF